MKTSTLAIVLIVGLAVTFFTGIFSHSESPYGVITGEGTYFRERHYGYPFGYIEERCYYIEVDRTTTEMYGVVDSQFFYPLGLLVDWGLWSLIVFAGFWIIGRITKKNLNSEG